jgi:exonuclease III
MIILSLNIRGLGGSPAQLALKRLFQTISPEVLFLQETKVVGSRAQEVLSRWLKDWSFATSDSIGLVGGLLTVWSPKLSLSDVACLPSYIKTTLKDSVTGVDYTLINTYDPFVEKKNFWEPFFAKEVMNSQNLIVGGDLNFTLSQNEVWGISARTDPLGPFLQSLLEAHGLVDVQPTKLVPTWRNNRKQEAAVAKRLDRFLVSDSLMIGPIRIRSWVETGGTSDHRPVVLSLDPPEIKPPTPFKFNPAWLEEEDYKIMFQSVWTPLVNSQSRSFMQQWADNLSKVKKATKSWATDYNKCKQQQLKSTEAEIAHLFQQNVSGIFSEQELETLKELELK